MQQSYTEFKEERDMFGEYKLPEDLVQNEIANKYLEPNDVLNLKSLHRGSFKFLKLKPEDRRKILIEKIIKAAIIGIENYIAGYKSLPKKYYPSAIPESKAAQHYPGISEAESKKYPLPMLAYEEITFGVAKMDMEDIIYDPGYHRACSFKDILLHGHFNNYFKIIVIDCLLKEPMGKKLKSDVEKELQKVKNLQVFVDESIDKIGYSKNELRPLHIALIGAVYNPWNQNSGMKRYQKYLIERKCDSRLITVVKYFYHLYERDSQQTILLILNYLEKFIKYSVNNKRGSIYNLSILLKDEAITFELKILAICLRFFADRNIFDGTVLSDIFRSDSKILCAVTLEKVRILFPEIEKRRGFSQKIENLIITKRDPNFKYEDLKDELLKLDAEVRAYIIEREDKASQAKSGSCLVM